MPPGAVTADLRNGHDEIYQGQRKEVLYDGYYYDITDWIQKHPGGSVIKYYTQRGEDATQAIQQFHFRSAKKVSTIMKSFKRRPATDQDRGLDKQTLQRHQALSADFSKLSEELVNEGYFKPCISHVVLRIIDVIIIALLGYTLFWSESLLLRVSGVLLISLAQGRLGWIQHEGGHNSLTGHSKIDKIIQGAAFGLAGGLSAVWWNIQHNKHHAMPQRLKHDVDLESMPFVAYNVQVVRNATEGKGLFIKYQSVLYLTLDIFLLAFWWRLYLHPRCVIYKKAYIEFLWIGINFAWVFHLGYWYFLIGYLSSIYLLGNFVLNHTHLPVANSPTHWVEYCLQHTADIQPSWWCDWWMGYLNYQIEHHLFPSMPQFRNKLIVGRVRALAAKHNIPYHVFTYPDAIMRTFKNLHNVSKELQQ